MIENLIRKNRTCRRFYQNQTVAEETVIGLVNLARLSASEANLQPLKYIVCCEAPRNEAIFHCLGWAGYLKDWPGPAQGERPAAYIVVLGDTHIRKSFGCDHGIAAQSILLGAREKGLAGCIIAAINHKRLRKLYGLPDRYQILLVLALGRPRESVVLEEVQPEQIPSAKSEPAGDSSDRAIRYWRDESGTHHVPKRSMDQIILRF